MKNIKSISKKIIIITIIFQMIFMPISNAAFWDNVIDNGRDFISDGKNSSSSIINENSFDEMIGVIYNALLALGVILAVLIGACLGIKFMLGSVEEQAKIKEILSPYVIGCLVTFGAFGIWKIVINVLSGL